jgi:hypothetical protein
LERLLRVLAATVVALTLTASGPAIAAKKNVKPPERPPESSAPVRTPSAAKAAPEPDTSGEIKRGDRIEFDERLIQGQTAKAGALYLFDRKPSDLRSMVHERSSYRTEIVHEIFPRQEGTP